MKTIVDAGSQESGRFSRVGVISDCAPVDLVFIAELCSRLTDVTVIRTKRPGPPMRLDAATKDRSESLFLRMERRYSRCLVPAETLRLYHEIPYCEIPEDELNDTQGHDLIRSLDLDVLITRRTCILKESLFTIPKLALNVHQGLAPRYRGNHTLFWALYNGDPTAVATTVHRLAPGIDDGDIYGVARPRMHPIRSEAALSVEMMKLAANIIDRLLSKAESDGTIPEGKKQRDKGRLYLERHRTLSKNLYYFLYRKWRYMPRRWGEKEIHEFF